jgi:hypothetical protein
MELTFKLPLQLLLLSHSYCHHVEAPNDEQHSRNSQPKYYCVLGALEALSYSSCLKVGSSSDGSEHKRR